MASTSRSTTGGSRARLVVVPSDPTPAEPVAARVLLDFLRSRTTGLAAQDNTSPTGTVVILDRDDLHDDDLDAELMDRLQDMYVDALPGRVSAIAEGARARDTEAVASAAHALAGTSGQLGHPEVAEVCRAIAGDARRGVLAHARLVELRALAGGEDGCGGTSQAATRR